MNKARRTLAMAGLTMAAGAAMAMAATAAYAAPADGSSTFTVTSVQDGPGGGWDHGPGGWDRGPGDRDPGDFRGPGGGHRGPGGWDRGWDNDGRWVPVGTYPTRTSCNIAGWWLDRHERRVVATYCVPGRGRSYVLF